MIPVDGLTTTKPGRTDFIVAAVVGIVVALVWAVVSPVAAVHLQELPAFTPLAGTFLSLPLFLTALVFFNQYAITRMRSLAVLGGGFVVQAILSFANVVEFPGVFDATGLFSESAQTASYLYNLENLAAALFAVLYTVAAVVDARRHGTPAPARFGRTAAFFSIGLAFGAWFVVSRFGPHLPILTVGDRFTFLQRNVVSPSVASLTALAFVALIAVRRFVTITDLWLTVAILAKGAQVALTGPQGAGRFSAGWYYGRFEAIVAAIVVLTVFLIRLNRITLSLAARNRVLSAQTEDDAAALAASELRYRALAESLPQLVFTLDAAGRVEYANARFLTYCGIALANATADGISELIDERDRERSDDLMRAAIGAGTGFDFEFRLRNAASATYAWFLCRGSVARDGAGTPVRWFGTLTEIEEQKRAEQRESFLARATETFGASLDLAKTLHAVARFAVPVLGIWSRAEIFGVDGSPGAVADSAPDASSERVVVERMGAPGNLSSAILDRLALGEYALVLDPTDALRGEAVVAYPIFAREEVVGVLHVVVAADFGERSEEARLGRAYARRAAIALERARLYERERRIADTLQRAMLPADLPTRSDVIFSAVYAAASESERVGGDFYDAFDVPDGRIAIVIGDVAGHGLHAAVTMGEVRQSIRAAAFETASPSQVLDRSSRLFVASGRSGMVTAVMSFFDPATRRLTYATAGHPAPLLRIGTTVERLGGDGLPLGLRDGTTFDVSVVVPPGAALAYFTDGLIEFDRDVVGGEQLVEAAFAASGDVAPADAAEAVRELVLGDRAAADDVAILIMTLAERTADEPAATSARAWHFHATDRRTAWLARRAFSRFAATVLDAERADDAELVYGELLANVVQHAPGLVSVAAGAEPDGRFAIVFEDDGPGFDYEPQVAGDDAEHGRGWAIIARLASTLAVERLERGSRASVQLNGANAARTES